MLRRVLLSMVLLAPAACTAGWSTFQDPNEQAFTIDVPQGWTVKGGMFRLGYSDVRAMIDATSPDGKTNIRLGDVAIPIYFVPNQFHPTEGDTYDLGAQAQMTVANYRSALDYAALYARTRFQNLCGKPAPRQPEAGQPLPSMPSDAPPVKTSSGEFAARCDSGLVTYVFLKTSLYQGFWGVESLGSYLAPADKAAEARSTLTRMAASLKLSDQWRTRQKQYDQEAIVYQQQRQQQRRREISLAVAQAEMKMQGLRDQVTRFEAGQAGQAKQVEDVGNILTGITPTTDPLGDRVDVFTGTKSNYYTDGRGHYLNANEAPAGWTQLQVIK